VYRRCCRFCECRRMRNAKGMSRVMLDTPIQNIIRNLSALQKHERSCRDVTRHTVSVERATQWPREMQPSKPLPFMTTGPESERTVTIAGIYKKQKICLVESIVTHVYAYKSHFCTRACQRKVRYVQLKCRIHICAEFGPHPAWSSHIFPALTTTILIIITI
jgi:hypothetical protein